MARTARPRTAPSWSAGMALLLAGFGLAAALFPPAGTGAPPPPPTPARVVIYPEILALYLLLEHSTAHVAAASLANRDAVAHGILGPLFPEAASLPTAATTRLFSKIPAGPEELLSVPADVIFVLNGGARRLPPMGLDIRDVDDRDAEGLCRTVAIPVVRARECERMRTLARSIESGATARLYGVAGSGRIMAVWTNGDIILDMSRAPDMAHYLRILDQGILGASRNEPPAGTALLSPEDVLSACPRTVLIGGGPGQPQARRALAGPSPLRRALSACGTKTLFLPALSGQPDNPLDRALTLLWIAGTLEPWRPSGAFSETVRSSYRAVLGRDIAYPAPSGSP